MVKGTARRVVVIKSPDKRVFDQAIFILREDALRSGGVTAEDILGEACRVAGEYLGSRPGRRILRCLPYLAVGLVMGVLGWTLAMLV